MERGKYFKISSQPTDQLWLPLSKLQYLVGTPARYWIQASRQSLQWSGVMDDDQFSSDDGSGGWSWSGSEGEASFDTSIALGSGDSNVDTNASADAKAGSGSGTSARTNAVRRRTRKHRKRVCRQWRKAVGRFLFLALDNPDSYYEAPLSESEVSHVIGFVLPGKQRVPIRMPTPRPMQMGMRMRRWWMRMPMPMPMRMQIAMFVCCCCCCCCRYGFATSTTAGPVVCWKN